jgi:hypothetical protein
MAHFMDHLAVPMQSWWQDLGDPKLTPDLQRKLIDGVAAAADGRSIADLAQRRDRILLDILEVLQKDAKR